MKRYLLIGLLLFSAAALAKSAPAWFTQWQGRPISMAIARLGPPFSETNYAGVHMFTWRWTYENGLWGRADACVVNFVVNAAGTITGGNFQSARTQLFRSACRHYLQ